MQPLVASFLLVTPSELSELRLRPPSRSIMLALITSSPVSLLLRPGPLLHGSSVTLTTDAVTSRHGPPPMASAASPTVRDQMKA